MDSLPLAEPYPSVKTFPVEVRSAGAKGLGVFARRNISRGEVCCFYDGVLCSSALSALFVCGEQGYVLNFEDSVYIAGFQSQMREGGVAQLCNDASTDYRDDDLTYVKHINTDRKDFANGRGIVFIAKKRIPKGGELLYSYGSDYWETRRAREKDDRTVYTMFRQVASRMIQQDVSDFNTKVALAKI